MSRRGAILKQRQRTRLRPVRAGATGAFWFVLAIALAVGGGDAISGLPQLADVLTPHGLMAAQASDGDAQTSVTVGIDGQAAVASGYAPQTLQPVVAHDPPEWISPNVPSAPVQTRAGRSATIAIVIDDLGADAYAARRATALPRQVTLSFLPYPALAPTLSQAAARAGHEVLVHVPMQPEGAQNPGPMALVEGLDANEIRTRLDWALARIPDADGINNHEGSRFTADCASLIPVAETLADRHLLFLDSRTTADTEVVTVSRAFGVASAGRDIFLDDVQTPEAVAAELAALESRAKAYGVAIAIGHPHDATLDVLAAWTADAARRGFRLVPVSTAIRLKTENQFLQASRELASAVR